MMVIIAAVLCLFMGLAESSPISPQGSDLNEQRHGYNFIYHHMEDLLLTVHAKSNKCYFSKMQKADSGWTRQASSIRNNAEDSIISIIETGKMIEATSLPVTTKAAPAKQAANNHKDDSDNDSDSSDSDSDEIDTPIEIAEAIEKRDDSNSNSNSGESNSNSNSGDSDSNSSNDSDGNSNSGSGGAAAKIAPAATGSAPVATGSAPAATGNPQPAAANNGQSNNGGSSDSDDSDDDDSSDDSDSDEADDDDESSSEVDVKPAATLVRESNLNAMRSRYHDRLADFHCVGKDIFELTLPKPVRHSHDD